MSSHEIRIAILQFEGELNSFQWSLFIEFQNIVDIVCSAFYKQLCKFLNYPKKAYLELRNEL